MKKIFKLFVFLIFVAGLGAGGAYLWYTNAISSPNSQSAETEAFNIPMGTPIDTIASDLLSAGLIQDKTIFLIYAKLNPDKAYGIEAGDFNIPGNLSIIQMFDTLQEAMGPEAIKVTILEGLRYDEVITALNNAFKDSPNFSTTELTSLIEHPDDHTFSAHVQGILETYKPEGKNLEGFLFPDTYLFYKDASAQDIVEKLISTLFSKLTPADMAAVESSDYSLYEVLTVASILEKEANPKSPDEPGMVADIIYKRLEHGVENTGYKYLELDATLAYPERDWSINVYPLKRKDTPYNTFMHPGLTPTPITNPGLATIHGAIYRIPNSYYYYIYDMQGRIWYAETLAGHERNCRLYL